MSIARILFSFCCLFSALLSVSGQAVRISEFMAANTTTFPDNADFDDYSDWIELENTTDSAIDLSSYYLSDDLAIPLRWKFPAGTSIPGNSFFLVRADGYDAGPGETFVREAAPWGDFTTKNYHTNFKLSAAGESVVLSSLDVPAQEVTYLPMGATWKYYDQGNLPAPNWFSPTFNDDSWISGAAELGYGDDDEATLVDYGPNSDNKYPTTYFRTTFEITDPLVVTGLNCLAKIDDGAVIYFNGEEIARMRMPTQTIEYDTYASGNADEDEFDTFSIPASALLAGTNILAIEVHQSSGSSSDLSLDIEIKGVESTGSPTTVDSVDFGEQIDDVSFARDPNNNSNWTYFGDATPEAANTTFPTTDRTTSATVSVSPPGGFYETTQFVTLSTTAAAATIRYTLDGSRPHQDSPAYDSPLSISSTDVLRARTFESDKVPGDLATETYFINEPSHPIPVVGFTVDPNEFFDNDLGIYQNVFKGREAATTLEYYEGDQNLGFKVNAGTKIGGENIWRFAQKPLNISMRGKYGDDLINYQIFPGVDLESFDSLGLRNGGDNWPNTMLRDAMAPSIVNGQMKNEVSYYRPVVLYMNGSYWGIHNARMRLGDQYFFNRYQIGSGGYDLVANKRTITGVILVAEEGDLTAYNAFQSHIENNDMSIDSNYSEAASEMDVNSFIDYCVMTDWVYESSWNHNQEFWRERKEAAKWHWNINDIDRGLNINNITSSLVDNLLADHPIFDGLMDSTEFKNRFIQRYAAHMSSTFHPDRIAAIIDNLATEVEPEIERHIAKWASEGGFTEARREAEIAEIKQFAIDRSANVYSDMASILNIENTTSTLTMTLTPSVGGQILINEVPILLEYNSMVKLYNNIPFEITAKAAPGYVFTGWSTGDAAATISQTLTGDTSITAIFARSDESVLTEVISSNTTLTTNGSPYTAYSDIVVETGTTLTIEPGVTLTMPERASIYVEGTLIINGTEAQPVTIEPREGSLSWGGIGFRNSAGTSLLNHFVLSQATHPQNDPVNLKAAISALNSILVIDSAYISAPLPIFTRGGSLTVRNSFIHPTFTGDGINVKSGLGLVEDCTIRGNDSPDTDAIDFDDVPNGVIQRNRIYAFRGENSDAIDIGEGCTNLLISENRIYNSSDKGVSIGQGSVVTMRRNLIVGCVLGVGVKDLGSTVYIDQNTFAENDIAVASYQKNFNKGGGIAHITNTIFYRSKDANTTVDSLSILDVNYSLSDTLPIPEGTGNISGDPLITEAARYNFSLMPGSPAIDSGDPDHALDPDSTRADMGARYVYDPEDYPFLVPNVIVINEIMSNGNDWIELYNTSSEPVDLSGWYLSDSENDLQKIRIEGLIEGNSYRVFTEESYYGPESTLPERAKGFRFSENGETAYVYSPGDGIQLPYLLSEKFGPSARNVSRGRYFKASTNTFNFVAMASPTRGSVNSLPKVGPIVISEIMYHPQIGDAEYLELHNISSSAVTLYDSETSLSWQITEGISYEFPISPPIILQPDERCLLVRDETTFLNTFNIPENIQMFQWTSGGLDNSGERIEISSPGDIDDNGIRKYIREDRVDFSDSSPWPIEADGGGYSLSRIYDTQYGNDVANWIAALPTPGAPRLTQSTFEQWARDNNLPLEQAGPLDDPDGDNVANLLEFALGSNPGEISTNPIGPIAIDRIQYNLTKLNPLFEYTVETSIDLDLWTPVATTTSTVDPETTIVKSGELNNLANKRIFFRLKVSEKQ